MGELFAAVTLAVFLIAVFLRQIWALTQPQRDGDEADHYETDEVSL